MTRIAVAGCFLAVALGAAAFAQSSRSDGGRDGSYVLLRSDGSSSMDGNEGDRRAALSCRSRYGDEYLWFRRNGVEYIVTDRAMLRELDKAYGPMAALGRRQAAIGEEQAQIGNEQSLLGAEQASVAVPIPDLTADLQRLEQRIAELRARKASQSDLGRLQADIGALQAKLSRAQAAAGVVQAEVGAKQAALGEKQAALGTKQAQLGREQAEASRVYQRHIADAIERALRTGLARQP